MDINCTLNCTHQKEGKCRLNVINNELEVQKPVLSDCPYYKQKGSIQKTLF